MTEHTSVYVNYPPRLTSLQQSTLVQCVKDWSLENELIVLKAPFDGGDDAEQKRTKFTNAPLTLFPSPFPKALFEQAQSIQTLYNELYAAISSDEDWLEGVVREWAPFSSSLFS